MTPLDIIGSRLTNQHIAAQVFDSPARVVQWLGAVQSQDYAAGKWAVGLRMNFGSDAALEQAFTDGAILRTHVLRPTWHFVTPDDIRWMVEFSAKRIKAAMAYNFRRLGLNASILKRSNTALAKALQGGKQLTRLELVAILKQRGIKSDNLGYLHMLMHAELDCLICSGGRKGKQFTYALLEERAPHARKLSRDESLAELTLRYFASRGPATLPDYAWWSGLTISDAKAGLELLKSQLNKEVVDGETYWYAASMPPVREIPRSAWLLPNFDEYMVGYTDRSMVIEPDHAKKLEAFGIYLLNPAVVIKGKILGTWKRTLKKDSVLVEPRLLASLNKTETRLVEAAAESYAAFLGLPLKLRL